MGAKVQFENYLTAHYPMKDLNNESNGASWASCFGESNLSNGQFYLGVRPRTISDSHLRYDKDFLKQTMLEHDAIFKNQVYELHRLYRVQRDMMDEARRKEQYKRRIPYETSSSSSPVPSDMQYEGWNGPNLPLTNSIYGQYPISAPETVQSSLNSTKGKGIQVGPSSLTNCYSPKNSESESRPTKLRRRMLDLQLPADDYIDTDEVVQFNDVKDSDYTSPSSDKNRKFVAQNGNPVVVKRDGSSTDLYGSRPKALADLNEPVPVEEATSVASVDFLRSGGGTQCDSQYRDFSTTLVNTSKHVLQNPKHCTMNGAASNNVHFENRTNGADWFCYALESENKGSTRSINQGMCLEKLPQSVHILRDQVCQPPSYQTGNQGKGDFHSWDLGKPGDQCASSWGKPGSYIDQKPMSGQRSPYLTSATLNRSPQSLVQSNDVFGTNTWNLNNSPSVLGNETPVRNGFYEGSSSAFKGSDYVNNNKKVACSSINYYKAANCIDLNPVKGMNLNVALPNGLNEDHTSHQDVKTVDKDHKSKDPLAVLPWLRGKAARNNEVENSRNDLNSHESGLSRWGSSVASNSCEVDIKVRKILGVPIFENPPTPKVEGSKPILVHCCTENKESEIRERKGGFDMNVPCDPTEAEFEILKEQTPTTSLRHCFDLNSCVPEEEIPCESAFSVSENRSSIRFDTGIDLEAPVILENDEVVVVPQDEDSLIQKPDDGESELARSVASAIVAMSSFVNINQSNEEPDIGVETGFDDPLHWFVEIACSNNGNDLENGNNLLPEGLDEFEMMTLRQKECNEEEYFPKPSFLEVPNVEERETCALTTPRTRKGNARRGRQKRDFQRDILPGLTSLSRHEVTEDLQMFGGLMRAIGHPWQSGPNRRNATRNGCARGRRRSVRTTAAATSPDPGPAPVAALCALPVKKQNVRSNNTEAGVDDRSLTGWGKTTRRPRRQRCPAGNPAGAPPPVPE